MLKKLGLFALGLSLFATAALAQPIVLPTVTAVGPTDLFQDVVKGIPKAQNAYATAGQISSVTLYKNGLTITTDPAYTFGNGVVSYFAHAAGTITTVTLTTEPNPSDGKRECYYLDQTTSTLTWTANTGQTLGTGIPTAGVSRQNSCITYQASNATWYASP